MSLSFSFGSPLKLDGLSCPKCKQSVLHPLPDHRWVCLTCGKPWKYQVLAKQRSIRTRKMTEEEIKKFKKWMPNITYID